MSSSWRSKISNKKFENKQISKTSVKTTTTDNTYESSQQTSTINTEISTVTREKQQVLHANTLETPIEWEQILDREFQSIDIDADGYISVSDMQSVLKNFSHIYNSNELILRIFEELDLNHDQRISKQEFKLYKNILLDREKRFHRSTFEEKFDSIFILFDRNQDNYISRHEIRETMHNLGEYIDDNLLEEMMQTADINHDDRISREEFKKLLLQLYSNKTK